MSPHTRTLYLVATLFVTYFSSCFGDLINDVCAKASNPPSCNKILLSDPLASQAKDIPSLGFITIDIAQAFSELAESLASSLVETTTDPKIKGSLSACVHNFDNAMVNLDACKDALSMKDIKTLSGNSAKAYLNVNICNDNFKGLVAPKVKQATENTKDACAALLAISKLL